MAEPHTAEAEALAKEARVPLVLAELLIARGITDATQAYAFLNPDLSQLNNPFLMLGMTEAVERLEAAIARHEPILLYGDYDVDGTTAVVLLKTAIEMLGGEARACLKKHTPPAFAWSSPWTPACALSRRRKPHATSDSTSSSPTIISVKPMMQFRTRSPF